MSTVNKIYSKCQAGFQNRSDTWNGRLAFVVGVNDDGQLKSEKSWNGWRDNSIDPIEFDNTPSTFYIARGHKRYNYGHFGNGSTSLIRVYDIRGIEFEITVENLTTVLHYADIVDNMLVKKGSRTEPAEFVYGFLHGGSVCLVPTDSPEYDVAREKAKIEHKRLKKSELVVGRTYQLRDGTIWTYTGDFKVYDYDTYNPKLRSLETQAHIRRLAKRKKIAMARQVGDGIVVEFLSSPAKIAVCADENTSPVFDDLYQATIDHRDVNRIIGFGTEEDDGWAWYGRYNAVLISDDGRQAYGINVHYYQNYVECHYLSKNGDLVVASMKHVPASEILSSIEVDKSRRMKIIYIYGKGME